VRKWRLFSALFCALEADPKRQLLSGSLALWLSYTKIPPVVEPASRSVRTEFHLLWIFSHSDLKGILVNIRHLHLLTFWRSKTDRVGLEYLGKNPGERMPRREVRDICIHISNKKTDGLILPF